MIIRSKQVIAKLLSHGLATATIQNNTDLKNEETGTWTPASLI